MTVKNGFFFCFLLLCQFICAQQDSIALDELILSDRQLRQFSETQQVMQLNDSVIDSNRPSLASLLNYNTTIYFKENGPGMVASPSFRGTTAQQTAVVWNGINVNSSFNGQTDFGTVNTKSFSSISVRPGGGSVIYGSSAIGGTIHLNNDLSFGDKFENSLSAEYGSFNAVGLNYGLQAASETLSVQAGVSHNSSDNDFDFPQPGRKNLNGQYRNSTLDAGLACKIDPENFIRLYSYAYDGERHFSLISPSETPTKYRNLDTRNLLEWTNVWGALTSKIQTAYLTEEYEYFGNIDLPASNNGKAETFIAKYDGLYRFNNNITLNAVAGFTQTDVTGTDVGGNKRQVSSLAVLFRQRLTRKFGYEAGIRQEITANYDSPLLFSIGADYRVSPFYTVKINASKNFRIPTFNDLYWFEGGNSGLKPETSLQAEIGNVISYKNWKLSVTGYYISISDMIQWLPGTTTLWLPVNVNKVRSYGVESTLDFRKKSGKHEIALNAAYSYTVSENERSGKQLIYVPYHKATGSLAYSWKRFSANAQMLFCGEVFTRSDNDPRYNIDSYLVANLGLGYGLDRQRIVKIGACALNLFDENYRVVAGRPFPGRNYTLFLTLNF